MGLGSEFTFPLLVTISSSPSRGLMESYCYDSAVGGRWQAVVFDHGLVAAVEGASYDPPFTLPAARRSAAVGSACVLLSIIYSNLKPFRDTLLPARTASGGAPFLKEPLTLHRMF